MSEAKKGECLVAREVQVQPKVAAEDDLVAKIENMTLEPKKKTGSGHTVQVKPADFVTLQSIRSSALARKTNTTSKIGKGTTALFNDLLNNKPTEEKDAEVEKKKIEKKLSGDKEVKKEDDKDSGKEEEEEEDDDDLLISRGPVRTAKTVVVHHPYHLNATKAHPGDYGTAAQSNVIDYSAYSAYGAGYECGASSWQDSPETAGYISNSSTPDSVQSSAESGYSSTSPGQYSTPGFSPLDNSYLQQQQQQSNVQKMLAEQDGDMPDNVSEFILAYSNMIEMESKENLIYCRPPSTDSSCMDSPMSAGSAPHFSPGQPQAGSTGRVSPASVIPISTDRPARQRLRVHIGQESTEQAMLWMCKCVQGCNVNKTSNVIEKKDGDTILFWQDKDKDTFLHICLLNRDVAKAYAIVEQQLKQERKAHDKPPFDLRNRFDESPLFIAVLHRLPLFVEYLLELNADPNVQSNRHQRETALIHAASRGMGEIVKILLRDPRTKKSMENEEGMTALLAAVCNNGFFDEVAETVVDNVETVRILIDAGLDVTKTDNNGRNIFHIASQKCDHVMLNNLSKWIPDEVTIDIINRMDVNGMKPINILETYEGKIDSQLYQNCFFALLTCNANVERHSPTPCNQPQSV